MPRVTYVKAARKDNPICKKGESYYWWKFRHGGKHMSLAYPKPSQLTQSAYLGSVYDLIEQVNNFEPELGEEGAIETFGEEITEGIIEIREQCQESLDNMPESLQYSPTGELLQEREVRDAQEEHDTWSSEWNEWEGIEPQASQFDSDDQYEAAVNNWENEEPEEPEVEEFEEFENVDMVAAVEGMLI